MNRPTPPAIAAYEAAKKLARDPDPRVRERVARRADLRPELLYFLAEDPDTEVRRQVAGNPATPPHAHPLLARDGEVSVRCTLAEKISRLVPHLDPERRDQVYKLTVETLEILARDQAARVRRILAEALKSVANAPATVIRQLARDADAAVAVPVLQFSPILTDGDLIEVINSAPVQRALAAISRRSGVGESVASAIVAAGDEVAIAALLANASAQIREETLDRVVDNAPNEPAWHEPLVRRPGLPGRIVKALARFVAAALLGELTARADLDSDTAREVAAIVSQRLEDDGDGAAAAPADPFATARAMQERGELDEAAVTRAAGVGDRPLAQAMLAVLSGVPLPAVRKIVAAHSARAMTALAWKAKLSMRAAIDLQKQLARVPAPQVLYAREGTHYPMSEADMNWQIEFFGA